MYKPTVSIIVTCYNKRGIIADCIKSVLNQNTQDYELIVVDDGSTDGSGSVINKFCSNPKVKIIQSSRRGAAAARNLGIRNATGRILLFLDGDSVLNQNALSKLLSSVNETEADCVGGELRAINDRSAIAKTIELMQNEIERKWPFGAFVAYKRTALEKAGEFDEGMEGGEDVGLFLTVKKLGFKCIINPKFRAKTLNPESLSGFFQQRFTWGMGFAQLTEKHKETFTKRIKFCFVLTFFVLTSPLLVLVNTKMIWIFLTLLTFYVLRYVPQTIKIARKSKDKTHSLLIPLLRLLNSMAYTLGWSYWKMLELTGKRSKLEAFI